MNDSTFTASENLVDFHCHVDLYPDPPALIAECESHRIYTLAVTTTPKAWKQNLEWTKGSNFVRPALGLHPQLIAERAKELDDFERLLPTAKYVGEVGLDRSSSYSSSFDKQLEVFNHILNRCAAFGDKVLSLHSLRAATPVLDAMEQHLPPNRGQVVLHWFTGSKAEARRAVALGCYFSINAQMLNSTRTEIISMLPLDRLLTESDGPFTNHMGRPSRPSDMLSLARQLALARGVSVEQITSSVCENCEFLFDRQKNR